MNQIKTRRKIARPATLLLSASLIVPPLLAGCGGGASDQTANVPPPPGARAPRSAPVAQPRQGMSTGKKVALLAGAAALYYIYNKRKNQPKTAQGPEGKYFLSKNGRIYYRNLKTGAYQWVSPPKQPIQVPAAEAQQYQGYSGYNNQNTGRGFGGYGPDSTQSYNDTEPAVWNQ